VVFSVDEDDEQATRTTPAITTTVERSGDDTRSA
jgi:hypothetical protein